MKMFRRAICLGGLGLLVPVSHAPAQPCQPGWTDEFQIRDLDGVARAATVFDTGGGARLILGGTFSTVGGVPLGSLVAWDGTQWAPLGPDGSMVTGTISSFLHTGPGEPPGLYISGSFEVEGLGEVAIALWDGSTWTAITETSVPADQIVRHDDGSGHTFFLRSGSHTAKIINGSWTTLGSYPADTNLSSIAVFDDGFGAKLYAAGSFTTINKVAAPGIAVWNGVDWSPVAGGLGLVGGSPTGAALEVFDDADGPALYLGGHFDTAGGQPALNIARLKNGAWSALGAGVGAVGTDSVSSIKPYDNGTTRGLLVCGTFASAGGAPASNAAFWSGGTWSDAGAAPAGAMALGQFDDGRGPAVAVGAPLFDVPGLRTNGIACWSPAGWSAIQGAETLGEHHRLRSPVVLAGLDGRRRLYGIVTEGSKSIIQEWDGQQWADFPMPPGGQSPQALLVYNDGSGPALHVACFASVNRPAVLRWNGASWVAVGNGLASTTNFPDVQSMASVEVGSQRTLYVGGRFSVSGTGPMLYRVAAWNGTAWTALGTQFAVNPKPLAVVDHGDGPVLYGAGYNSPSRIHRWNSQSGQWELAGALTGSVGSARLDTMIADENGAALVVGGDFAGVGGVAAHNVARWDGTAWSGIGNGTFGEVTSLRFFDDGLGPALFAGVLPFSSGDSMLYRWDGVEWIRLAPSTNTGATSLTVFDDGGGPDLIVTGWFDTIEGVSAGNIGRWDGCLPHCAADFNGDSFVDGIDYDSFNSAFAVGHDSADTNADGFVDGIDYDLFMNAYEGGC